MGRWGYCLFQGDSDLDCLDDLGSLAGLDKIGEEAAARAKAEGADEATVSRLEFAYSLYAPACHDPELVRNHLDSGILTKMCRQRESVLLRLESDELSWDPCFLFILFGACLMTLGCKLPDSYISMLKKVYTEGGLWPGGIKQLHKALFGPNGFQNGVPYDFESKNLLETVNAMDDAQAEDPDPENFIMPTNSSTSVILRELREKHKNPEACGSCGAKRGRHCRKLLQCGKCRDRMYCGIKCQKKHWKVHKKVCEPAQQ